MGQSTCPYRPRRKPKRDRLPKPGTESHQPFHRRHQTPPGILKKVPTKIGFGDLPAELRNRIYELALKPSLSKSVRIILSPGDQRTKYDLALDLLCTCTAVRREAWSFLYEKNDFRIDCVLLPRKPFMLGSKDHHLNEDGAAAEDAWHPSRLDSYKAGLKRFIDCTNHGRAFQSIRSITLAYHRNIDHYRDLNDPKSDWSLANNGGRPGSFASLVMNLKLLPERPFYSLTINHKLSLETRTAWLDSALEIMEALVRSLLDPESGSKRFCRRVVEDIVSRFYERCCYGGIGACLKINV